MYIDKWYLIFLQFSYLGSITTGYNAAEMTNVQCTGTETSIDDCPHENGSGYCATSAQIRCIGTISDFYCLKGIKWVEH